LSELIRCLSLNTSICTRCETFLSNYGQYDLLQGHLIALRERSTSASTNYSPNYRVSTSSSAKFSVPKYAPSSRSQFGSFFVLIDDNLRRSMCGAVSHNITDYLPFCLACNPDVRNGFLNSTKCRPIFLLNFRTGCRFQLILVKK